MAIRRPPSWRIWGCTRCSIAGRRAPASARRRRGRSTATNPWGTWRTSSPARCWRPCRANWPSGIRAIPRPATPPAQRAALLGGLQQGPPRGGAQRQHHQRGRAAGGSGAARGGFSSLQRHRDRAAPGGAIERAHSERGAAGGAAAYRRGLFAGISGRGPHHRGARSAWLPAAGDGGNGDLRRPQIATPSPPRRARST